MNTQHSSPIVLVTGGSRGIGRAICVEFAACGYQVIINFRSDKTGAKQTLSMVENLGAKGRLAPFDVTDGDETQSVLDDLFKEIETVDVLVNNAGITADGLFVMMARKNWDQVLRTSLDGFFNTTRPILEKMIRHKRGIIISIASVAGLMGNRGQTNYSAAKAGLIGATRSLSAEVARLGIRVNAVAPGLIETDMIKQAPVKEIKAMIPMARVGKPEEVARVVRFLSSEDASYITGQVICINGGMF